MAGEPDVNIGSVSTTAEVSAMDSAIEEEEKKSKDVTKKKKTKKGILSRMWNAVFSSGMDDFERRLERISKEEAAVLTRMRRRAQSWGKMKRHLILFFVLLEFAAVGYALMAARTAENWKIRALRFLPMFLLPAVSSITYSAISSFINMCERKDHKTLEKLRAERQSKIDELKEKTNYYITQQLIQRYDTDPAAKAAAATVLASKLGADSGLKVFLEDESKINAPTGKSNDVELMQSSGLRNRKQSLGSTVQQSSESSPFARSEYAEHNQQIFVDHYQPRGPTVYNNGWLSRIAALLVCEDPTQCYALICGNCHMHNGLANKEDFPYVTYICPHCRAVNGPKIRQELVSHPDSPNAGSTVSTDRGNASGTVGDSPRVTETSSPEASFLVTEEIARTEASTAGDKWNRSTCEHDSKENSKSSVKLASAKATTLGYFYSSSEDEDVCPICLEEYTEENPKIVTKCSHHFHLGCIYEWMERNENCPVCGKVVILISM